MRATRTFITWCSKQIFELGIPWCGGPRPGQGFYADDIHPVRLWESFSLMGQSAEDGSRGLG